MPRENVAQWNFTSGEVSPYIAGRVDTKVYSNGLRTCENFIVRPQGGASRRLGSRHVKTSWTDDKTSLLVPFVFSDVQAYVLQFGDGFIHFYKDGEPLLETTSLEVEEFTLADSSGLYLVTVVDPADLPGWGAIFTHYPPTADNGTVSIAVGAGGVVRVTTSIPHGLRTGARVFMRSSSDTSSLNGNTFFVTRISSYAIDLTGTVYGGGGSTGLAMFSHGLQAGDKFFISGAPAHPLLTEQYHIVKSVTAYNAWVIANVPYAAGAVTGEEAWTIPIEVVSPYAASELTELRFAQSADILYIMHPDHPVMKLTRLANDGNRADWLLSQVVFTDGPYLPANDNAPQVDTVTPANGSRLLDVYLEVSAYTHTATVTSATAFAAGTPTADVGEYLEYRQDDQWRLALMTAGAGGAFTGTVDIIDNVLLYLDEATRFKNTPKQGSAPSGSNANSAWTPVYGTRRDGGFGVVRYQKLDPNNQVIDTTKTDATAGVLTSNFANTFGVSDVGKYIRYVNKNGDALWAKITKVGLTGATANHAAALTMVTNNATGNFVITNEVRAATVKAYRAGAVYALFTLVSDVGRHIRIAWGGRWVWGIITAVTSTSEVTVRFYSDLPRDPHDANKLAGSLDGTMEVASTTGRSYNWRLGAWSITTGYPSTGCFHEQRLMFARTNTQPATFWGSVTGDFENMSPTELDSTVLDDNGINYTLASGKVNAIKWMESGTTLVLGTNGGEWLARSTSVTQEPITPTNISVLQQSRNGSSRIAQPLRIGSEIAFVDRSEQNVMAVAYLFSEDRLEDKDLTIVSEHILRIGGNVVQTAFQQNPHSIGWFLLSDGTLAAVTYNADQEVIAWHRHAIAGTGAFVESICVVPNADGTADDLYMLVKRTHSGTQRFIEVMEPEFYPSGSSRLGMQFMDCARVITGFTGTVLSGLNNLTGQSVGSLVVTGNGVVITPLSFSAGVLTLSAAYDEVAVGLPFTSTLKSLPPEGGSPHGVSQGMKKKMPEMKVRVADSFGMNAGWAAALAAQDFNAPNFTQKNESETTLPFYSGIVPLAPKTPYREDVPWTITYALPYPLNVLAVISVLETSQ